MDWRSALYLMLAEFQLSHDPVLDNLSRDRKVVGDLEGARYYGSRARCFNVAALAVSLLFFLIFLILVIFSVSVISGKSFSLELGSPQN
ncbi:interferon-induced transmembrane protein 1-like [Polypterus senegalus]|uniref:interferon-induced transmembrane protein 1-like n=1 Tax=Polypterus senegalus TaxID=55291 RepID=UPI0019669C70|nr:interferon-induced transmembrane protein 1-like [Polypterus senegalus]